MGESKIGASVVEAYERRGVRLFPTGATRDTDDGKLDYEGFLAPRVLARYAEYMHKHRKQADGSLRDSDNWQKGMPRSVYRKSLVRHVFDFWRHVRNPIHIERDDYSEDLLCAILFNAMGYLNELLLGRDAK